MASPVIFGLEGTKLTSEERAFFREVVPYGYILFARNIENPAQVRVLTDSLRELTGHAQTPILIDQEGGRVARLKPPHWPEFKSAAALAACFFEDEKTACQQVYNQALAIAEVLTPLGINVNCAPVADIPVEGADPIISDRAYGHTPERVAKLAREMARGLMDGGVKPVLKHIPGHGRATVDSHLALPRVSASLAELRATDFAPFKALGDLPYAMTAHIVYDAIDSEEVATFSEKCINLIRFELGFKGILMSDDLSMKALSGDFETRARKTLKAGCDLVLHCNGNMDEMKAIMRGV
jgi:beta-N-acetylhexosaminidase